ncbi:MAG: universal stress protein [Proteobacteria bacterium]|nr:universal stress protein [Pseudomonadota bacterium]
MYKSILVTGLNGALTPAALELAAAAARPAGGHVDALHIHLGPAELAYYSTSINAESAAFTGQLVESIMDADRQICARSRAVYEAACAKKDLALSDASWSEVEGDCAKAAIRRAYYNDLVVLGRPAGASDLTSTEAIGLIVGCGRPVLIAPPDATSPDFSIAAIAWKESACAARAVAAALPLLCAAKKVYIVSACEEGKDESAIRASARSLAIHLERHGVEAHIRILDSDGRDPCPAILDTATSELHAGVLVMGAYGHDRAREFVFGGFTRRVLHGAGLPVLMAH